MTSISSVDQAIILLRERLRQVRKQGKSAGAAPSIRVQSRSAQPLDQIRRMLAVESLPPRDIRRALVRNLLAEAFGDAVANDLSFQAIADQVTAMLDEDAETRALLDRAVAEVKAG